MSNKIRIEEYRTKDRILYIHDMLNVEAKRSKISIELHETDQNGNIVTSVYHVAKHTDVKLLCHEIIMGQFAEWYDIKASVVEEKTRVRTITIRKDSKYRQPYILKVENGLGEINQDGIIIMTNVVNSLTLLFPEPEIKRIAMNLLDYIRDWETINFRKRQEAMTVYNEVAK
jgi:hypothetical protein